MSEMDEILNKIKESKNILHLGAGNQPHESLRVLVDASRDAIGVELDELKKLSKLSRVGASVGFILIALGVLAFFLVDVHLGTVTGGAGVLTEIIPVLLFRRVDESRKALRGLMPDYRLLFAALVLVDSDGELDRKRIIKVLTE